MSPAQIRQQDNLAVLPVQLSATSHTPADVLHSVVAGSNTSAGQAVELPVQFSAMSHAPADALHSVVAGSNTSAGQAVELPVQVSAMSHTPADGRHSVVAGSNPSAGQAAELPVQFSATSHTPRDGLHSVAGDSKPSAGQAAELPVQYSATSHQSDIPLQSVILGKIHRQGNSLNFPYRSLLYHMPLPMHTVVARRLAGQLAELPVQVSAASHNLPIPALGGTGSKLSAGQRLTSRAGLRHITYPG